MTLTSMLDQPESPLRRFLADELPDLRRVRTAFRAALPAGAPVLRPTPPYGVTPQWTLLGMAIDHRLRCALRADVPRDRAVGEGAALVGVLPGVDPAAAMAAARTGADLLEELQHSAVRYHSDDRARPVSRSPAVEDRLARLCFGAALFEEIYRCPDPMASTLLKVVHPRLGLEELLQLAPEYAVRDITSVTAAADKGLAQLRAHSTPDQVVIAPTFQGSTDVAGADGDWLVNGWLVDAKATIHPQKLPLVDIYQLAGYALLDYHDAQSITTLGWYSARAGTTVMWDVTEFFALLGAKRPLPDLRDRTARLLQGHPHPSRRSRPPTAEPDRHRDAVRDTSPTSAPTTPPRPARRSAMVSWQDLDHTAHGPRRKCGQALVVDTGDQPAEARLYTRAEILDRWGSNTHINPPDERLADWVERFDLTSKDGMLHAIAKLRAMTETVDDVHGWSDWSLPVLQDAYARLFRWWTWRYDQLDATGQTEVDTQIRALDRWCKTIYDDRAMEGARD